MAKITSNEYVKIAWVLDASMTPEEAKAPPLAKVAAGIDLSPAIAWQDFALGATDSDDVEDRGITDPGNAVTRGFANFEATLSFFRDADPEDTTSDYVQAWETFKIPRTYGYLIMRVADKKWNEPWAEGDRVSVFRFVADVITDDTEGDDAVKFSVNFLPQGVLYPYTMISDAGPISGVPATIDMAVGDAVALAPEVAGFKARAAADYHSDNPEVVNVGANGVLRALGAGEAEITVSHPAATAPVTTTVTAT